MSYSHFSKAQIAFAKLILQMRFYKRNGNFLNFKHPTKFYDKVLWASLYTDTSLWSRLADKYEVREYVSDHLPPPPDAQTY